ncbi:putative cell survival pathways protein [Physocladia obscura]|uniref:Cell survival pathways protein n=1 Tax=Physocladia obscura TaxID=109957 RepID=A0AAD5SV24_9FUNG|nr:putative cell survival pathways protein [Physocladia obscura]
MLSWGKKSSATTEALKKTPLGTTTDQRIPDPQPGTYLAADIIPAVKNLATLDDLKWKLVSANATESMTFQMSFQDGTFAFMQMVYSTMGLSPNVMLTCKIYKPDGTKHGKTINHSASSFKTGDAGMSASCDDQMRITYNPTTTGYAVSFKLSPDIALDVEFTPTEPAFKIGDGTLSFSGNIQRCIGGNTNGSVSAQFLPKNKVTGTIMIDGVAKKACGVEGLIHHAIQIKPQGAAKWNFVNFQNNKGDALMLYEFESSRKSADGLFIASQGCIVCNGRIIAVTTNNRAVHVKSQTDKISGYAVPTQMYIYWMGKTLDSQEDVKVEISIMLTNQLDTIDVLAELPYLLRKFIQTFITAPFLYSWNEKITAKITIGDQVSEIDGTAFIESSFLCKD